jgi:tetratricopeptide (TPR) repeat protein
MSKKKKHPLNKPSGEPEPAASSTPIKKAGSTSSKKLFFLYIFLAAACVALYVNTLSNDYCLDDAMMITQNEITQKGFDGIGEHIEHSFLYGYMHQEGYDAASSHWRPIVLISFAIEIGLWGPNKPGNSHAVNLLIYMAIVLLLFRLFHKYLLKDRWLSFFTALIFAIHPIHTEVVANIKGRDEMLVLLLILLSLLQLWRFVETKKFLSYLLSLSFFFLSMATKENGITFLAGVPVMLYFFSTLDRKKIALYTGGFVITTLLFILIRNAIVPISNSGMSDEITNNPYLYARGTEAIATKFYVLLLFIKMIIFPHPLSYDYSYNQIPYVNIQNPWVWVSALLYLGLLVYALRGLKTKNRISFAILMFFITLSVSTNILVETGVLMAERMLFTPSIFAILAITLFGQKIIDVSSEQFTVKKWVLTSILIAPVFVAGAIKTIYRNHDWKNDNVLNLADIPKNPQSTRVNGGAGTACLRLADEPGISAKKKDSLLKQAIAYYKKALDIHPAYNDPRLNMGVAYTRMDSLSKAEECWNEVRKRAPSNPKLAEMDQYLVSTFFNKGALAETANKPDSALLYFTKADSYSHQFDSLRLSSLYRMAGVYYKQNKFIEAKAALTRILAVNPNYLETKKGIEACDHFIRLQQQGIK